MYINAFKLLSKNILVYEGSFLTEEEMKVLKFMNEITGRTDMNEFAKKADLAPNQILQHMQKLSKEGLLKKVGAGFAITEKGKNTLKALAVVSDDMRFHFYSAMGKPLGVSAGSIKEFCELASNVDVTSLEFHLERGDFENWFRTAADDAIFADEFAKFRSAGLKGEDLRKAIGETAESRYYLKE
jgi:predicted transcriptional regulator